MEENEPDADLYNRYYFLKQNIISKDVLYCRNKINKAKFLKWQIFCMILAKGLLGFCKQTKVKNYKTIWGGFSEMA